MIVVLILLLIVVLAWSLCRVAAPQNEQERHRADQERMEALG